MWGLGEMRIHIWGSCSPSQLCLPGKCPQKAREELQRGSLQESVGESYIGTELVHPLSLGFMITHTDIDIQSSLHLGKQCNT